MRRLRVAIGLVGVLVGLLPGVAFAAQTAPVHTSWDVTGVSDLCGGFLGPYEDKGVANFIYNAQTNTVTATWNGQTSFTCPNGDAVIFHNVVPFIITNVVNPDGSQSYTWTFPLHLSIKSSDGGVIDFQSGILKYAATVYPDGTIDFTVVLDKGPTGL